MSERFENLVSQLRGSVERKRTILAALISSGIENEVDLREIIRGRNIEQVTSLFERKLNLDEFAASALAGLLVRGR